MKIFIGEIKFDLSLCDLRNLFLKIVILACTISGKKGKIIWSLNLLQAVFRNRRLVIAVATKKQVYNVQYVKSYKLKYIDDGNKWRYVTDKTGNHVVSCDFGLFI